MLVTVNQSKHMLLSRDLRDTLQTSSSNNAQKRFEVRCIFCVNLLNERVLHAKRGISADVRFGPNLSVSSPAMKMKLHQDESSSST